MIHTATITLSCYSLSLSLPPPSLFHPPLIFPTSPQDQGGFGSTLSPSPTNLPTPSGQGSMASLSSAPDFISRQTTAQSLPATPSAANVRTFTDYSGEHTRLTTLHGSTGALEVNNLGGFKLCPTSLANGSSSKFASALESSIDGIVRTNSNVVSNGSIVSDFTSSLNGPMRNGRSNGVGDSMGLAQGLLPKHTTANMGMTMSHGTGMGGMGMGGSGIGGMNPPGIGNGSGMSQFHSNMVVQHSHAINPPPPPDTGYAEVDDMADVFTGLSFKEPSMGAAPGYGRARPRRSSAPVGDQGGFGAIGPQNGYGLWGSNENPLPEKNRDFGVPTSRNSPTQQQFVSSSNGSYSAGLGPHPSFNTAWANGGQNNGGGVVPATKVNIWSQGSMGNASSRPNSQTSSSTSDGSIQNSPIYSPTNSSSGFGGFVTSSAGVTSCGDTMMGLLTTGMPMMAGMGEERAESRSPFRVRIHTE